MIFRTSREAGRPSENVKKKKREKNAVCAAASKITLDYIILIHNKVIAISIIILNELQSHFPICLINNGRRIYQSLFMKKTPAKWKIRFINCFPRNRYFTTISFEG